MDRLSPIALFRGHWKALSDYTGQRPVPDVLTRALLLLLPSTAFVAMLLSPGKLAAPGSLLSGVALLAGGLLSAFGQLSTLRLKLTERASEYTQTEQIDRDFLDETASHLLVAAYLAAVTAIFLVLGMNFGSDDKGAVSGLWAALASATATYVGVLFLISLPRLYSGYTTINKVRRSLSGTHRGYLG